MTIRHDAFGAIMMKAIVRDIVFDVTENNTNFQNGDFMKLSKCWLNILQYFFLFSLFGAAGPMAFYWHH